MVRKLALAAGIIFAVSFFMPAMDTSSGLSCLDDCWRVLVRSDAGHTLSFGAWLYYSGFVAANALFVVLFCYLLLASGRSRVRSGLAAASLLQVFSWIIVNLVSVWHGEDYSLRIGYFLWLASFVLVFLAHVVRIDGKNSPAPVTP
jgi:hypothetical protein